MTNAGFEIKVVKANILKFEADVMTLKYTQSWSFLGQNVMKMLPENSPLLQTLPRTGQWVFAPSEGVVPAPWILLIGAPPRKEFTYDSIHDLARLTLTALAEVKADRPIRHIAVTVHGAGWGFDEKEAFRAMLLGFHAAVEDGNYPKELVRISVVEAQAKRADVLTETLTEFLDSDDKANRGHSATVLTSNTPIPEPIASVDEPSIFVAMPFAKKYNDVFYLAIQPAVKDTDHLCIRLDLSAYTGDIIETIKTRIRAAKLVIALLDGANPNVYLEVGFAWGVGVPTVLVVNEEQFKEGDLPFDVRSQKYLRYDFLYELRPHLTAELRAVLKAHEKKNNSAKVEKPPIKR